MQNLTSLTQSSAGNITCAKNLTVTGTATFSSTVDLTGIGTGLKITNATNGIETSLAAIGANGRIAKFAGTCAAGNMGDGYGAVETELTLSGTVAGMVAASSTWVNVTGASVACGSNVICTRNDGIYVTATGTPMANATAIIGGRLQYVADGGGNPGALYLWQTNIYDNVLTALLSVNTIADMGGSTGAASGNDYKIPLFKDETAGQVWYVNIYHS